VIRKLTFLTQYIPIQILHFALPGRWIQHISYNENQSLLLRVTTEN